MAGIKKAVLSAIGKGRFALRKNSPEILLGVGFIAGVGCVVAACIATVKSIPIVEECKDKLTEIDDYIYETTAVETGHMEKTELEKPETLSKKKVKAKAVGSITLRYLPAFGLGVLSMGCILTSYKILDRRLLGATMAYEALDAAFMKYRRRVVEQFGEDTDWKLYNEETVYDEVHRKEKDEDGNEIDMTEFVPNPEKTVPWHSIYAVEYTNRSVCPGMDVESVRTIQNMMNDKLMMDGYLLLNDVYTALHIPINGDFIGVGWISPDYAGPGYKGDGYVDFGLFSKDPKKVRSDVKEWLSGMTNTVLIDPNVDGPIYKYINAINKMVKHDEDQYRTAELLMRRTQPRHV